MSWFKEDPRSLKFKLAFLGSMIGVPAALAGASIAINAIPPADPTAATTALSEAGYKDIDIKGKALIGTRGCFFTDNKTEFSAVSSDGTKVNGVACTSGLRDETTIISRKVSSHSRGDCTSTRAGCKREL